MNTYKDIQLIIPMAGIGKRFKDAGYTDPKPLININGTPMIKHIVDLFEGIEDITFICNERHIKETDMLDKLKLYFPNSKILNIDCHKKGPVYTVNQVANKLSDEKRTIVAYCDFNSRWDKESFYKMIYEDKFDGIMQCYKGFHPHMLGDDHPAYCREKDGYVTEVKEKACFSSEKMNEFASNGIHYFRNGKLMKRYFKELVEKDINVNNEYYISLVFNLLLKDDFKIGIFPTIKAVQWGTPFDLEVYKKWESFFSTKKQNHISSTEITTLILPLAGKGQRFIEKGYKIPKPFLNINEKPMVTRAVECLPSAKNQIFISLKEHNSTSILKKDFPDCSVVEIDQVTKGQACSCKIGIESFNIPKESPILISGCDFLVKYNEKEYDKLVNDKNIDIIVWSFRNNSASKLNPNMYAWLDVDENGFLKEVSCKKFIYKDVAKTHAITGVMFFRKAKFFLDGLNKNINDNITINNEFYVDDVLNQNIKNGLKIKVFEVSDYICLGTPNDYLTYLYWEDYFKNHLNQ